MFSIDEGSDLEAKNPSPVARHVAVPVEEGAIRIEREGEEPIVLAPPLPPTLVDRAVRRREIAALGDEYQATADGILDAILVGVLPWERAVLAMRSVGPFRLPPALKVPWRKDPMEAVELQAWSYAEVLGEPVLSLLVVAVGSRAATANDYLARRVQLHVLVAPSGLVERAERRELERVIADGDRAFDEV